MAQGTDNSGAPRLRLGQFAAYIAVACSIVAIFVLTWELRSVVLLAFGGIILAAIIRALARPLMSRLGMRDLWAVLTVLLLLLVLGVGVFWLFGQQVTSEMEGLGERLPVAIETVRTWLEGNAAGRFVIGRASGLADDTQWLDGARQFAAISVATIGQGLLMLFVGIYLAANPKMYLDGLVRLFPMCQRAKLQNALRDSGEGLRKWLLGQLVSMVSVGLLTGLGLWMVGAPLPLALGLMAGLLEFIPVVGPILAIGPGVLVALTEGPQVALYATIVYVVVQQLEGNVIMPLAQRWAVELPPAYGLLSLLAFGLLFGFLGVFFGSPLAVVVMCLVQSLYIEQGLEKSPPRGRKPG